MDDSLYDLSPGKRVGKRYTIVEAHRQGGLSTAFEVVDDVNQERCELQLFAGGLFDHSKQVSDFSAILSPWKNVDSPSVVRLREIVALDSSTLALVTAGIDVGVGYSGRIPDLDELLALTQDRTSQQQRMHVAVPEGIASADGDVLAVDEDTNSHG